MRHSMIRKLKKSLQLRMKVIKVILILVKITLDLFLATRLSSREKQPGKV